MDAKKFEKIQTRNRYNYLLKLQMLSESTGVVTGYWETQVGAGVKKQSKRKGKKKYIIRQEERR